MPTVRTDRTDFLATARRAPERARVPVELSLSADPFDYLRVDPGDGPALAALSDLLDGETLVRGDCDVPYPCGAFGWLSYDVAAGWRRSPTPSK